MHNTSSNDLGQNHMAQAPPQGKAPRFLIIGAGSRGGGYAEAISQLGNGVVAAVADPIRFKREALGRRFIWGEGNTSNEGQVFESWKDFLGYEQNRRKKIAAGDTNVPEGVDGAFVCVLDEMHREVVVGLAPLGLHIMCEKPLATSMEACIDMYKAISPYQTERIFSIGHVLRYSPHNMLLRKLLVEEKVIGNISSVIHTEPVGWWHFTHSYVRGNWRNSNTTGPSLLTKSCHDIDLLLWLICSPEKAGQGEPHLPTTVSSTGSLQYFKKNRKPAAAGDATNCMSCPLGDSGCKYSAKNVYLSDKYRGLGTGNLGWPTHIVVHDIEDYGTHPERVQALSRALAEDYDASTPAKEVSSRNWFGRCVYEADNNVCDEQFVTITWPETETHTPKRVSFHMVAQTVKQCDRYSNFYGTDGEIYADSNKIVIENFTTGETRTLEPKQEHHSHGGGDLGLTRQFVTAVDKVKNEGWDATKAQNEYVGCTLEECLRSHAMVFAAEEARTQEKVVRWEEWWDQQVASKIKG